MMMASIMLDWFHFLFKCIAYLKQKIIKMLGFLLEFFLYFYMFCSALTLNSFGTRLYETFFLPVTNRYKSGRALIQWVKLRIIVQNMFMRLLEALQGIFIFSKRVAFDDMIRDKFKFCFNHYSLRQFSFTCFHIRLFKLFKALFFIIAWIFS